MNSRSSRRAFLHLAAGAVALPAVSRGAWAQAYPSRPVRLIIGYTPGGSADITARLTGQWLSERLGQPVVVDNRLGCANGNIGTEFVARSAPDGYTLVLGGAGQHHQRHAVQEGTHLRHPERPGDPGGRWRQTPIQHHRRTTANSPLKSVKDLIAQAKAQPGTISYASSGNGATTHMSAELFKSVTGDVDDARAISG